MKQCRLDAVYELGHIITIMSGGGEAQYDAFVDSLTDGQKLIVTYAKDEETRSQKSNRLFHALVGRFADQEGMGKPHVKMDFKRDFGVHFPIVKGFECNRPGYVVEDFDGLYYFYVSTAAYKTGEMSALIKGTILACQDAQVPIDDILKELMDGKKESSK